MSKAPIKYRVRLELRRYQSRVRRGWEGYGQDRRLVEARLVALAGRAIDWIGRS